MLKSFKKKSLKAKIGIIAAIVVILLLFVYVLYSNFKPEPAAEYDVAKATYGTITDALDVNGTVESGVTENFVAIEGATVEEVFVNVGDRVKKGDVLATFNVSGAAQYLSDAEKAYKEALKEYNDAKNSSDTNSKRKAELEAEIDALNLKITAKEKEIEALSKALEQSAEANGTAPIPQDQIDSIAMQMLSNGASLKQILAFREAAGQVEVPVVDDAMSKKQEELMQKNLELAQLNSELSALYAENTTTVITDDSVLEALKAVADSKKKSYDAVKAEYDAMKSGWVAENDGIVTTVNIKAGERFVPVKEETSSAIDISALLGEGVDAETASLISSLMGNTTVPTGVGLVVESYEDMIVSVTVGKSDLLKIKTGMKATVTSLDSVYEGEVVYVSATATGSSGGLDIGSITSSLMGGATGASGAVVKVKINNPDENVVIGFDVDIKIILDTIDDVLKIPVESVVYNSGEYSVFVYDEAEGTVSKRVITKGLLDDTSYEVVSGLKKDEIVVRSPDPNMTDGTKITAKGV